jgi:hypothetical protein
MARRRQDLGARRHVRVNLHKRGFLIPAPDAALDRMRARGLSFDVAEQLAGGAVGEMEPRAGLADQGFIGAMVNRPASPLRRSSAGKGNSTRGLAVKCKHQGEQGASTRKSGVLVQRFPDNADAENRLPGLVQQFQVPLGVLLELARNAARHVGAHGGQFFPGRIAVGTFGAVIGGA